MNAKFLIASVREQLSKFWQNIRSQSSGPLFLAIFAAGVCLYSGWTMQRQAQPLNAVDTIASSGLKTMQMTNWIAEYLICDAKTCKQVLRKSDNGKYAVASETLPVGSGRYVSNESFSVRPNRVRLSHRLTEQEETTLEKNWQNEKLAFALAGQPVCENDKCRTENLTLPLNKFKASGKSWVQFDSHIGKDGQFGPQSLPPLLTTQAAAPKIFEGNSNFQRGLFFEIALAVLAPLFVLALTIWLGAPLLYATFSQYLIARAAWAVVAADTFLGQAIFMPTFNIKNSYALAAFFSGWMFASLANFVCAAWMNRRIEQRRFNTLWSLVSVVVLLGCYVFPAGTAAAALFLRTTDALMLLACAAASGAVFAAHAFPDWDSKLSGKLRSLSSPAQTARWKEQLGGVSVSLFAGALFGFWIVLQLSSNQYAFNWGVIVMPVAIASVLMFARPQLTENHLHAQKELVVQQELLVKLLSQLPTFRHRAQAISLVMNFCNRELPKLGFSPPSFTEQKPEKLPDNFTSESEVAVEIEIKGPYQSFGWFRTVAEKHTEKTAIGMRMIEALSTALAQHLDTLRRTTILESEATAAQKFIPREIMKLFSIPNTAAVSADREFTFSGTGVSVLLKPSARVRDGGEAADSALINEMTQLFTKGAAEHNGYVVNQEGMRWSIVFSSLTETVLNWIETTQTALRSWNTHRQNLGMPTYECFFGVHKVTPVLRFTERADELRAWFSFDLQSISSTLADVAAEYNVSTLLSQDYVNGLTQNGTQNSMPPSVRPLDRVWNRSKTATVDVFEFFGGDPDMRRAAKQRSAELFSQGIRLYLTGYFEGARSIMSQILESDPHDKAAQRLLGILSQNEDLRAA
ncbi:MAG: hypothetical protein EBR09_06235 [Proteobacteria bacterium]|nr:hypothetical protein [Pseudomonadota bacterium]